MARIFVKFVGPDVDGGSDAEGHKKELEVFSWNHGFSLNTYYSPGARVQGKTNHQEVSLSFEMNNATVPMLDSVITGANFDTVTIACYRASGGEDVSKQQAYLKIILTEAICSTVQVSNSAGGTGSVLIALNYSKVQYEYDPQKPDSTAEGKAVISYDLKTKETA